MLATSPFSVRLEREKGAGTGDESRMPAGQSRLSTREKKVSGVSGTTGPVGRVDNGQFLVDTSNRWLRSMVQFRHPDL
jgi:hypothetical protein